MVRLVYLPEFKSVQELLSKPPISYPQLSPVTPYRVPISPDAFNVWISKMLFIACDSRNFLPRGLTLRTRISMVNASSSSSLRRRFILFLVFFPYEISMPILLAIALILSYIGKLLCRLGFDLPIFSIIYWIIFKSFMLPNEILPPGDNGYTRTLNTDHTITFDALREALNSRNSELHPADPGTSVRTIALSYKHYPATASGTPSRTRLSEEDLLAIHKFLNEIGSCKVRFWIDTKLPPSDDSTFERWIDRGLRPYARYMTFICPSALQYRSSSFWLANEYHFANATKGVLFFDSHANLIFEYYNLNKRHVDLRFFHILIDPHMHRDRFRQDDCAKFVRWAAAYLSTPKGDKTEDSPLIDTLEFPDNFEPEFLHRVHSVVRVYGEQPLPVIHGKSWSPQNPLLLNEPSLAGFELTNWIALVNPATKESMKVVYVMLGCGFRRLMFTKVVVLVMTLDQPYFHRRGPHITSKVLREVNREVLLDCAVITWAFNGRIDGEMEWR